MLFETKSATLCVLIIYIGDACAAPLLEQLPGLATAPGHNSDTKLTPLARALTERQAGSTVFNYIRNVLDQAEETFNSALDSARGNPTIQRLAARIQGIKQQLGLPIRTGLIRS